MAKISLLSKKGQAVLLSVLTLGSVMLGATAIAGFLTLYQIRMASTAAGSAKAIFAADAGIDWAVYSFTNPSSTPPSLNFNNGASVTVTCYDVSMNVIFCSNPSLKLVKSVGKSSAATRVLELSF